MRFGTLVSRAEAGFMSDRPIRLLAVLAAVFLLLPAAAVGNGGDSLSAAPELPTTVRQYGAKFGPDFWKVTSLVPA